MMSQGSTPGEALAALARTGQGFSVATTEDQATLAWRLLEGVGWNLELTRSENGVSVGRAVLATATGGIVGAGAGAVVGLGGRALLGRVLAGTVLGGPLGTVAALLPALGAVVGSVEGARRAARSQGFYLQLVPIADGLVQVTGTPHVAFQPVPDQVLSSGV